ncbi:MAG: M4 family metallopeptidase [Kiritimatiellae bacterium]|nr:M4 family metallopeptidase [Kiritimatiellia bacterium]
MNYPFHSSLVICLLSFVLASASTITATPIRLREAGMFPAVTGGAVRIKAGNRNGTTASDAAKIVEALGERLGIHAKASDFKVRQSDTDRFGRTHVRLTQCHEGIEVDGRELVVHFEKDGSVYEINGDYLVGLSLSVSPTLKKKGATLVIYCAGQNAAEAKLAWRTRIGRQIVFTDTLTGEEIHRRRAAPHAKAISDDEDEDEDDSPFDQDALVLTASTTPFPNGTATTVTGRLPPQQGGAEVTVGATEAADGSTYLTTTRADGIEIGILDGIASPRFRNAARTAYWNEDAEWFADFSSNANWTVVSDDYDCAGDDMGNAIAIAYNISTVLDYYQAAFARNSYDGQGGRVAAWRFWQLELNEIDDGFANAFWTTMGEDASKTNGCFFFGYDLSGERSETDLDTCGHELTHGITSWTADLQYEGESGALNESFSDIIGIACEFAMQPLASNPTSDDNIESGKADWLFDEDSGEPARSLAEPKRYNQPSRYKGKKWVSTADTSEDNDYGGVHSNSGVQNHFFYLLSEGGSGNNEGVAYELTGIGVEKAAQIAYLALTAYCTPNTDYATVMGCWDSAAQDLLSSGIITDADYAAIAPAWAAVMTPFPAFDATGEVLYTFEEDDDLLIIKTGKANTKGRFKVTATLRMSGKPFKFSGYATVAKPTVTMKNRKLGTISLTFSANFADGMLTSGNNQSQFSAERISPTIKEVQNLDTLRVGVTATSQVKIDESVESVSYAARKLPSGLRVNSKTGKLTGIPRKAGKGTATFIAKCKIQIFGEKKIQTVAVAKKQNWQVAALPTFAQGKFIGNGITVRVTKVGKISGTVKKDGKTYRLSAKSYATYADGSYRCSAKLKGYSFQITANAGGITCTLTTSGGSTPFTATKGK